MTTHFSASTRDVQVVPVDTAISEGLVLPDHFEELAREHGVSEEAMAEVKVRSLSIIAHKRRDGASAFIFGADIVAVATHFEEGRFEEFAARAYPYSLKHVTNFMRVAAELGPWRSRSIRASFTSTHLIRMLARTPEERDEILDKVEAGEKVTTADISSWGKSEEEAVDPMSSGGLKGLRALAQAKAKAGSASFGANVGTVIAAIDEAFESGKSIVKNGLAEQIQKPARQASGELLNLAMFVAPGPFGDVSPVAFPEGSEWGRVHTVLDQVGHETAWPKKAELGSWLRNTVLPVLRWAVTGSGPMKTPEARMEPVMPVAATAQVPVAEDEAEAEIRPVEPAAGKVTARKKPLAKSREVKSAAAIPLTALQMPDVDAAASAARP